MRSVLDPATATTADVLEIAAEHIRAGWTQGRPFEFVDGKVYCCANGAIWLAAGMEAVEREPEDGAITLGWTTLKGNLWASACKALSTYVGENSDCWNDSIGQTQDRVADTMLRLAKELRPQEPS
jgi:hypothetical protein